MIYNAGDFPTSATVIIPINTFDSNDPTASVTVTNLANTDVHIHKDGGTAQRNNAAGITMTIDYDSITGNHLLIIDTSDNTVADFYQAGHEYQVRVEGVTVDGATINAWVGCFSIERSGGALALIKSIRGATFDSSTDTLEAIRNKLPTNLEDMSITDTTGFVSVPDTQDVNVKTFGGETLTAQIIAAWKKFFNVASPTGNVNSLPDAVPGANGGFPTTNGTKINQTVDLTAGQSIACSDKTGFSLSATGADLILKSSTFVQAIVAAVNEFATYGLTALNTLLVTTGIKAASVPNVTLANGAHGGAAATITLQTPIEANMSQLGGVAQSATDLKDFADTGYDPSTHKVAGVVLTDTCTTNTDMRGTNGAYTGTPPTADAIGTDAAGKILVTPAQKIVTDADGKVTYSNTAPPTAEDIKTAIEAEGSKLDHLWEMTEDDAGVRRLTTNALEQAPSGGLNAGQVAAAVWDAVATSYDDAGSLGEAMNNAGAAADPWAAANGVAVHAAVVTNAAGTDIAADIIALKAETAELKAAVITNAAGTDIAADIIALKAETATILADTAELQTNQGDWATANGFSTHSAADVKTALEADGSKLDHLWEMTEDDGGVRRLTTNALELAPSGSGLDAEGVRTAIGLATANLDTQLGAIPTTAMRGTDNAATATNLAAVKAVIDAIKLKTDTLGGAGAIPWTYTVTDSTTGLPISDVDVWVTTDSAGTNVIATGKTNTLGVINFSLDAGTYYFWSQKSGVDFVNPDCESVTA